MFRASRPSGEGELADYRALLAQRLVRPGKLEIYTMNADGSDARLEVDLTDTWGEIVNDIAQIGVPGDPGRVLHWQPTP